MTRSINSAGLDLIKRFEGVRRRAYLCPAGKWTIGYGWTKPVDGKPVGPGMVITHAKAEELLAEGVKQYCSAVEKSCPTATDNQFGAMVSLCYNIGTDAFTKSSVARYHVAGDRHLAADAFLKWTKGGGRVLPGLVARRKAERALYLLDSVP